MTLFRPQCSIKLGTINFGLWGIPLAESAAKWRVLPEIPGFAGYCNPHHITDTLFIPSTVLPRRIFLSSKNAKQEHRPTRYFLLITFKVLFMRQEAVAASHGIKHGKAFLDQKLG
jgi:hypothetical protein